MGMAAKMEAQVDAQMAQQEDEMSDLNVRLPLASRTHSGPSLMQSLSFSQALRKKRLAAMQRDAQLKKELLALGHGKYTEIEGEKAFFEVAKESTNVVCHFYRDETWRCKIVDQHFEKLAAKYWKCRFVKINAEKTPFLVERLKVIRAEPLLAPTTNPQLMCASVFRVRCLCCPP